MIDLAATRDRLLAEIGAPRAALPELEAAGDPRLQTRDAVRLVARGSRHELFRELELALSARFAAAPRVERVRDLLGPLRNALGNAHKHGHHGDRSRPLEVEVVATRRGALIAVRDAGGGFDAPRAVRQLRAGERYFRGAGAGLRGFEAARSTVAWEADGRVALIRFLAPSRAPGPEPQAIARALADEIGAGPGVAIVEDAAPGEPARLRCLVPGRAPAQTRIFCGGLFAAPALAAADRAATARLRERLPDAPLRVPEPLAPLRALPRLALYDFDPWLDLDEYLAQRGGDAVDGVARRVAATLAALRADGSDPAEERRARDLVARLERRSAAAARFGVRRVRYGVDARFYLDRCGSSLAGDAELAALLERVEQGLRERADASASIDASAPAVRS